MAIQDKNSEPIEFTVDYYHQGQRYKDVFAGTEKEIRNRFILEDRVILKIAKTSALSALSREKIDSSEVFTVIDTLGDLLLSNIPLSRALDSILVSFYNKETSGMKKILINMSRSVREGKELSTSMAYYPKVFGSIIIGMITAGEGSGRLTESLKSAAHQLKDAARIKKEMIKNLTYPLFLMGFGLFALVLNANVIIPKIIGSELFSSMPDAKENIYIKLLGYLGYIVPSAVGLIMFGVMVLGIMYVFHREKAEAFMFKLPLVKEFFLYRNLYLSFHSLSKLIEVGVKIDQALQIVKASSSVLSIRMDMEKAQEMLRDGKDFSEGFSHLSPIEKAMLSVSFSSDKLIQNLQTISQRFYNIYIEKTESLAPKIYGTVLILMGGVFILIFAGIAVPYSQILKNIR